MEEKDPLNATARHGGRADSISTTIRAYSRDPLRHVYFLWLLQVGWVGGLTGKDRDRGSGVRNRGSEINGKSGFRCGQSPTHRQPARLSLRFHDEAVDIHSAAPLSLAIEGLEC